MKYLHIMNSVTFTNVGLCLYLYVSVQNFPETKGYSLSSYASSLNLTRIRRQSSNCNGFRCATTGDCISGDLRCDGAVDCVDGSDEFNDCKNIECPGYLFTCDYGACIDEDKKCNGKKDCRDNSDEAHCVDQSSTDKVENNCKSDQFQCKSGQCISLDDKCNGITDCKDKSDETKEACLNMYCPGFTFKCDYGACVDGFAECNGVKDCVDNSDEETENCIVKPPVTVITTPEPPLSTDNSSETCALPNHPANGEWTIPSGATLEPGDKVPASTLLIFNCNNGYKLSAESKLLACLMGGWNTQPPTCLKLCPPLFTTDVTKVRCYDEKKIEIPCSAATNGASAKFECATYHEPVDKALKTRFCWNGQWDLPPPQCIPVCGEKIVSAVPLIVNGQVVEKGNYPWVTAVFQKVSGKFINVCGGSMLTQRLILTAAHCVTNDYGNPLENAIIKVAVGKYYNVYKHKNDTQAQYSDVQKIIVHERYQGDSQRYASDIALLVTKDVLLLSKVVQPVCFSDLPHIPLNSNSIGVITGWGYTLAGGTPSDILREVPIPYKDDATCSAELPTEWARKYFTYDKFCAGHYNESIAVCKGDSGGGLVFQYPKDNRYYVHGIVSIGETIKGGCNVQVSSLYTKVSTHYDWVEELASQYVK